MSLHAKPLYTIGRVKLLIYYPPTVSNVVFFS